MSRTTFKQYDRPFKCRALPGSRKSRDGRKAAGIARRAAKSGHVEEALQKLTTALAVNPITGIEHHLISENRAKELLADSLLYEEKLQNRRAYAAKVAAKKAAGQDSPRARWGIYPVTQSGEPGETPIQICGIKRVAEQRAVEISQWGKRECVVLPYTKRTT